MKRVALTLAVVVGFVGASFASEQLAKQKGCMACHDMKAKKVGPSYADIAKKYAGRADAVDYLA
ncbi:MAG: c-type cytochrome, partial [Aquificaceae bacterium]|nr:c-type cytochrome [Aquificaceae bacterium]